jgi:histidinol dehydrogenase
MIHKMIAVVLVAVFVHGSLAAQTQPQASLQTPAQMQQVLRKAQDKGKAVKVTLNRKLDNRNKLTGKVSEISDTGFTFIDQKTREAMQVAYADVQEVKQKGMSRTTKILIVIGIVVSAVLALGFALACTSEGGPNC